MKKTTVEICVNVVGPEAAMMMRYVKGMIMREFGDIVERIETPDGELVITIVRPYDGPEKAEEAGDEPYVSRGSNMDGPKAEGFRSVGGNLKDADATDKPADEEADDCDCMACTIRRAFQAKAAEPAEPTVRLVPISALSFLAAMMAASKPKE